MRAALLPARDADLVIDEVPTPQPGPGQVLVKIAAAGVCHSDLSLRAGSSAVPALPRFPWILGHENSGHVAAVGAGVTEVAAGDAVVVWAGWGDGTCPVCRAGFEVACANAAHVGSGAPGGWAEYLLVPAARHLVPIGKLDPVAAAPLADAGLTAYAAVRKVLSHAQPSAQVVVIGAGGLGQFAVRYLRRLTAAQILVLDIDPAKRDHAVDIGAHVALDPADANIAADVLSHTADELGAAAVLDFVGSATTGPLAARIVRPRGRVVLIGMSGGSVPVTFYGMGAEATALVNCLGGLSELRDVVRLATQDGIVADTMTYPLDRVNDALAALGEHRVAGRAVLTVG